MNNPVFQVVMATFNGQNYLDEQISSIVSELNDGELLIHDDGSQDETLSIVEKWCHFDKRVKLITAPPQGGASRNFSYLLSLTSADYVFLADQDDVWRPGKVRGSLEAIQKCECKYGRETPILLHTDAHLIDEQGRVISESMWKFMGYSPERAAQPNLLLSENVVTGCTVLVNRKLLEISLPIPNVVTMHDHWLAMIASLNGKIISIREPKISYRQHSRNQVGAKKTSFSLLIKKLFSDLKELRSGVTCQNNQTNIYESMCNDIILRGLANGRDRMLLSYVIARKNIFLRPYLTVKEGFFKSNVMDNLVWFFPVGELVRKIKRGAK